MFSQLLMRCKDLDQEKQARLPMRKQQSYLLFFGSHLDAAEGVGAAIPGYLEVQLLSRKGGRAVGAINHVLGNVTVPVLLGPRLLIKGGASQVRTEVWDKVNKVKKKKIFENEQFSG